MLFQLIIHQFFAQYQNEMNSTKEKADACGSLITLSFLTQILSSK